MRCYLCWRSRRLAGAIHWHNGLQTLATLMRQCHDPSWTANGPWTGFDVECSILETIAGGILLVRQLYQFRWASKPNGPVLHGRAIERTHRHGFKPSVNVAASATAAEAVDNRRELELFLE